MKVSIDILSRQDEIEQWAKGFVQIYQFFRDRLYHHSSKASSLKNREYYLSLLPEELQSLPQKVKESAYDAFVYDKKYKTYKTHTRYELELIAPEGMIWQEDYVDLGPLGTIKIAEKCPDDKIEFSHALIYRVSNAWRIRIKYNRPDVQSITVLVIDDDRTLVSFREFAPILAPFEAIKSSEIGSVDLFSYAGIVTFGPDIPKKLWGMDQFAKRMGYVCYLHENKIRTFPVNNSVPVLIMPSKKWIFGFAGLYETVKLWLYKIRKETEMPNSLRKLVNIREVQDAMEQFRNTGGAIDIESALSGHITCISFASGPHAFAIPFYDTERPRNSYWPDVYQERIVVEAIGRALSSDRPKIFHNAPYDVNIIEKNWGIKVRGPIYDTLIYQRIFFPERLANLAFIASVYTNLPAWKTLVQEADQITTPE